MIRKLLSIAVAIMGVPVGAGAATMSSFTTDASIGGTEFVVGYETAASGGERKFLLSTLRDYMAANSQPADADLTIYAGITPSANTQTLLASADYAAWRSSLSLVIGTNVQAYDADLTTWSSVTPSANGQSLISAANYAAMRALLDLEIGTDVLGLTAQAADVDPAGTAIAAELATYRKHINADASVTVTEAAPDTATLTWTGGKWRTLAIDEATTLSYTAPTAGDTVTVQITGTSSDVVLTVPTTYSEAAGANRTAWTIPANAVVTVTIRYDGTAYRSYGDPLPMTKFLGTRASPDTSAGAITISDSVNGLTVFANTATEYDLEAAANWKGKVLLVHNCGTNTITIDPNASEVIYLAGAALTGGDRITISNTAGSYVALQSDGTSITVWGYSGTISDGN